MLCPLPCLLTYSEGDPLFQWINQRAKMIHRRWLRPEGSAYPLFPNSLGENYLIWLHLHATEAEGRGPALYQEKREMGFDKHMALSATVENK